MKKQLIVISAFAALSVSYAAPTFSLSLKSGTTDKVDIIYNQDASLPGRSFAFNITPPAGVTVSAPTPPFGVTCIINSVGEVAVGATTASAITDGLTVCTFTATGLSGSSVDFAVANEEHTLTDGTFLSTAGGNVSTPNPIVLTLGGGSGGGFNTTVNYSVGAGTGTGTFACDSGASGATVAGGTAVSCTAAPNGTDTSAITGCPAGATTSTNTTCAFTASTTADETVDLVATFTAGGTGPGPGTNPSTPGAARPVPALGVFGLLAMLASMFGAATIVLRRKR